MSTPIAKTEGLGCRIDLIDRVIYFLFEGMFAEDEAGSPALAAVSLQIKLTENGSFDPIEKYEEAALMMAKEGVEAAGIGPNELTPITWEQYQSYQDDSDDLEEDEDAD